jgi:uncharacterized membrane-anchored protein
LLATGWAGAAAQDQQPEQPPQSQPSTQDQQPASQDEQDAFWKQVNALQWQMGPVKVDALSNASMQMPEHYGFLDIPETSKFMRITENPPSDQEQAFAPEDIHWFATLSFAADGYVKDNDKIDGGSILESLRQGTEAQNEERRKNGWPELHVVGWRREPHYDTTTKRLEWAIDLKDSTGSIAVNFQTRILGRRGVTEMTLVTDPEHIDRDIGEFNALLTGYEFNAGDRYTEFQSGDKVAEYGLAALIVGGAAAAGAKTGLFKVLGKFIWIGVIAVVAVVRGFFRKVRGGGR